MAKPTQETGQYSGMNKGKPQIIEIVAVEGDNVRGRMLEGNMKGCNWTDDGWFAPATEFANCPNTGTQKVAKKGNIWPLAPGNKESYSVSGSNNKGESWSTVRSCSVRGVAVVVIGKKEHPTFEVVCSDSWNTRTWWVSPEHKMAIRFQRRHTRRGMESDFVADLN